MKVLYKKKKNFCYDHCKDDFNYTQVIAVVIRPFPAVLSYVDIAASSRYSSHPVVTEFTLIVRSGYSLAGRIIAITNTAGV